MTDEISNRSLMNQIKGKKLLECLRCGFKWFPYKKKNRGDKPRMCPECKSALWDVPK